MKVLVILLLSLSILIPVSAQEVTDKAKQKTEQRVDQKVDKGIDQGLDKLEGFFFGKKKKKKNQTSVTQDREHMEEVHQEQANKMIESMMGNMSKPVDVAEAYAFDKTVTLKVTNTNKNGKVDQSDLHLLIPYEESDHWGMSVLPEKEKDSQSILIYDTGNKAVITLIEEKSGEKNAMAMALDVDQIMEDMAEEKVEDVEKGVKDPTLLSNEVSFTKTGKTKTMHGYECHQYMAKGPDGEAEFWLAPEFNHDNAPFFSAFAKRGAKKGKQQNVLGLGQAPDGFIMAISGKTYKTGDTFAYEVTEISDQDRKYSMADWNLKTMQDYMQKQTD
ncbi:DUF4412 domain-containing protein [Persicobacter sp. CCB-QB2]|uniref:DUF4412 domain-containing protein n=1 Tax=Persicobacter sp. CCB-QB2 TaxID=1561025 RepID=UPI0006A9B311|nr:DUF4412 domain-containing protein [Persicobacter sp. CCB-QB2]